MTAMTPLMPELMLPPERAAFIASADYRQDLVEPYIVMMDKAIEWFWGVVGKPWLKEHYAYTTKHPQLKNEIFRERAREEYRLVSSLYDFRLDQRDWQSLSIREFFFKEVAPGQVIHKEIKATCPTPETWPTGTLLRYSQKKWLYGKWEQIPAFPDHYQSLIGHVLTTSARNMGALSVEEQTEFLAIEHAHNRRFASGVDGKRSAAETAKVRGFLDKMPQCMYIAYGDIDCSTESPGYDPEESPKRAVERAVVYHQKIATPLFGAPKWKLSNKAGGLHGVNGILPPEIQSVNLLPAIDFFVDGESRVFNIPTLKSVTEESDDNTKESRQIAEVLDTSPWHKYAFGRGGMYRTPGNYKTDQSGKRKANSVEQADVEDYVDELPWLKPLTATEIGSADPNYDLLPKVVREFEDYLAARDAKTRERLGLKPGQPIPRMNRLPKPSLELGTDPFHETAKKIKECLETGFRARHDLRVALSGAFLYDGIPLECAGATLGSAFDNQVDAVEALRSTISRLEAGLPVASWSRVEKLVGKKWTQEFKDAIRWDRFERVVASQERGEVVTPAVSAETMQIAVTQELEDEHAVKAAETVAVAKGELPPDHVKKKKHLAPLLKFDPTLKWWSPLPGVRFALAISYLASVYKSTPRLERSKVLFHLAGMFVTAGVSRGAFESLISHVVLLCPSKKKPTKPVVDGEEVQAEWSGGKAAFHWQRNYDAWKSNEGAIGGVWGLKAINGKRLGPKYTQILMDAISTDLEKMHSDSFSTVEVRRRFFSGQSLRETDRGYLGLLMSDRKTDAKRPKKDRKFGESRAWLTIESVTKCEVFGERGDCSEHGPDVHFVPYLCGHAVACRHCRHSREGAERKLLNDTWPAGDYLLARIVVPMDDEHGEEVTFTRSVRIEGREKRQKAERDKKGKVLPKKYVAPAKEIVTSRKLADRVVQAYNQHPAKKDWIKSFPHRYAFGVNYVVIAVPAMAAAANGSGECETEFAVRHFDDCPERVSKEDAIEALLEAKRSVGEAFDRMFLARDPYCVEFSWLEPRTHMTGANQAGMKVMPWPKQDAIRELQRQQAIEARGGLEVKRGCCPVMREEVDPKTKKKTIKICGRVLTMFHEKTKTGELVFKNSAGKSYDKREVWKEAERKGITTATYQSDEFYARTG